MNKNNAVVMTIIVMLIAGFVGFIRLQSYYDQRLSTAWNDWTLTEQACDLNVGKLQTLGDYPGGIQDYQAALHQCEVGYNPK